MKRADLPLAAAAIAAIAVVLALVAPQATWLRLLFGVPLAVLLPGLPVALYPLPALERLGIVGRITVAVGASLLIDMAAGLLLAATGIGLTPTSCVIAIASAAVLGNAWLAVHLIHTDHDAHHDALGFLAAGLGIVGLAVAVSLISHAKALQPTYGDVLQLWALPSAEDTGTVSVGVSNAVSPHREFHLIVDQGATRLLDAPMTLPEGESRTYVVKWSKDETGPITATLSLGSGDVPFRSVKLWRTP